MKIFVDDWKFLKYFPIIDIDIYVMINEIAF